MKREAPACTKYKKLSRRLNLRHYQTTGLLEDLWHLTARETPQGNVGKLSNADIALAVDYEGDADELIVALIECRWLDRSELYRLVVHDWHEHADDAVKKRLARNGLPFLSRHVDTRTDNGGKQETFRDNDSLPEPEPVPEPVPESVPEPMPGPLPAPRPVPDSWPARVPVLHSAATPSTPHPQSSYQPSTISDAASKAATTLTRDLKLAFSPIETRTVAQVIAFESAEHGGEEATGEWLLERAMEARKRGELVTIYWFKDRKFDRYDVYSEFLRKGKTE
jgi:hypothetical protein